MSTKKKTVNMKSVEDIGVSTPLQHKVPQKVKQHKKIKPKDVFGTDKPKTPKRPNKKK